MTSSRYRIKIRAYLELMRPANIITAFADILAGFSITYGMISSTGSNALPDVQGLAWLLLATLGLYGGGVVYNDFFDAELDAKERPERPIPSGRASRLEAGMLGTILLLTGIFTAFQVNAVSGGLASAIVIFILIYNSRAKHYTLWGPLFMGLCRGSNLLLGASIIPFILMDIWFLGMIPILYIAAITLISQGEVHGGSKKAGVASLVLLGTVFSGITALAFYIPGFHIPATAAFLLILGILILPAFIRAALNPSPELIRFAVKRGVLSLIVLNAVIASGFAGWTMGIAVLLLLPFSLVLGRVFSVT